jgi:hypothetical protein
MKGMNMKKIICMMLSILTLFTFVSCGDGEADTDAKNYVFVSGNVTIKLDDPAEPILSALGEPRQYRESPSCAFDGLDKLYVYAGFKLQTYPQNGKDFILSVELTDDSVATPEGIAIGATKDQVVTAYGTPDSETDTALTYKSDSSKTTLQFLLRDGKVTNILYLRETE